MVSNPSVVEMLNVNNSVSKNPSRTLANMHTWYKVRVRRWINEHTTRASLTRARSRHTFARLTDQIHVGVLVVVVDAGGRGGWRGLWGGHQVVLSIKGKGHVWRPCLVGVPPCCVGVIVRTSI